MSLKVFTMEEEGKKLPATWKSVARLEDEKNWTDLKAEKGCSGTGRQVVLNTRVRMGNSDEDDREVLYLCNDQCVRWAALHAHFLCMYLLSTVAGFC